MIETVKAVLGGQEHLLTYNPTTRRHEAQISGLKSSAKQPGGVYRAVVTATNDTGVSVTAENLPGLMLKIVETVPPALTLVSPAEGYVTDRTFSVVVDAADDDSGVEINTLSVIVDGEAAEAVTEEIADGFRITCRLTLDDGQHNVSIAVQDLDGNLGTLTLSYLVDTVPPELIVKDHRRVVDWPEIGLAGTVWDLAQPVGLTVSNGTWEAAVDVAEDGVFTFAAPLDAGGNTLTLTATDAAGNRSSKTARVIRLITDRTQDDVDALVRLLEKPSLNWTAEELTAFNEAAARGAYNYTDLNRVGLAAAYVAELMREYGLSASVSAKTDWTEPDNPTSSQMAIYLRNISTIRDTAALPLPLPNGIAYLDAAGANQIEAVLVGVDALLPEIRRSFLYSGEAFSGEF